MRCLRGSSHDPTGGEHSHPRPRADHPRRRDDRRRNSGQLRRLGRRGRAPRPGAGGRRRGTGRATAGAGGGLPLVRLHSECLTGDVFGSQRCDCGPQLRESLERISASGGYLLYLRQEGRGIGLYPKLDAYSLQDLGLDTYEANVALGYREDERDYTAAAQMLLALGAGAVALLTNNPDKVAQLRGLGIDVVDRVPTAVHRSAANSRYLAAKSQRAAHRPQAGSGSGTELAGSARAPLAPPAHRRTGRAVPGFGGRSPVL